MEGKFSVHSVIKDWRAVKLNLQEPSEFFLQLKTKNY